MRRVAFHAGAVSQQREVAAFYDPILKTPGRFWPVFSAPKVPKFRAKKPITRCPDRRTEWSIWNPIWQRPAGPQQNPRRTKTKLGPLPCAPPGLVHVPQSKTKNSGKR